MKRDVVSDERLAEAVASCFSVMEVVRFLGKRPAGGTHSHYKRRIECLGLDSSHFKGRASKNGCQPTNKKASEDILIKRISGGRTKSAQLRRALFDSGISYSCFKCGQLPEWLGNPLVLDIDHINEDWLDDRIENLRFLCPNCHSQFSRKLING